MNATRELINITLKDSHFHLSPLFVVKFDRRASDATSNELNPSFMNPPNDRANRFWDIRADRLIKTIKHQRAWHGRPAGIL